MKVGAGLNIAVTRVRRVALAAAAFVFLPWLVLLAAAAAMPLPGELLESHFAPSIRVLDRNGVLLREVRADDGSRARWTPLGDLGERAEAAILAAEDRRFYWHIGLDPIAMVRAFGQAILHRRIVSGASTLTQQLARTVIHRPKTLGGKLHEMALALRIEWSLSKREILEQYLNRAPFGPGIRGIEAASRSYFDRPVRDLSLAEVALLAGIPRGPSLYDPTKGTARAERRRNRIVARMLSNGQIATDVAERATREPVRLAAGAGAAGAPHFVRSLLRGALDPEVGGAIPRAPEIATTLDAALEREVEALARRTVQTLSARHVSAASVVVLDNATGEILAYVGSPNIGDAARLGENDGVLAKRQPGSALKPFVYELAFERLAMTPATLLPDVDLHIGFDGLDYHPQNYDGRYHGPVRVREALANSYNVPAVYTASLLGTGPLLERLRALGFASLERDASFYGPALALGDGEVRLIDLANAYATLARGGAYLPLRAVKNVEPTPEARQVLDRRQARLIGDILADAHARIASFGSGGPLELPFRVAVKTGTSKGFRDNWTVGYTDEITVATWVGNFDGTPMHAVSGVMGAGPLFRDVMLAAHRVPLRSPLGTPEGVGLRGVAHSAELGSVADDAAFETVDVCPLSGARKGPSCPHARRELFASGTAPHEACAMHTSVRLDVRNGLRAGADCPPRFVEERAFEAFDTAFAQWAKSSARPVAPDAFSPLCPRRGAEHSAPVASASSNRARLAFPFNGARFVYDDGASSRQTVTLRAEAPKTARTVRFFVDGRLVETKRAPFLLEWPLTRGTHLARAEADVGESSEPVEFTVR